MRILIALLSIMLLVGCVSNQPKEVLVPVSTPVAEPPIIEQPFLPVWLLIDEDGTEPDKVVKYYVKSLYLQRLHSEKLQCALDAYRTATEPQCIVEVEE